MQFPSNIWHLQSSGKTKGAELCISFLSGSELSGFGIWADLVWNGRTLCSLPPYWDDSSDSSSYTSNCSFCAILLSSLNSEFAAQLKSTLIVSKAPFLQVNHIMLNLGSGHSLHMGIMKNFYSLCGAIALLSNLLSFISFRLSPLDLVLGGSQSPTLESHQDWGLYHCTYCKYISKRLWCYWNMYLSNCVGLKATPIVLIIWVYSCTWSRWLCHVLRTLAIYVTNPGSPYRN